MPTPDSVAAQKESYAKRLEEELQAAVEALAKEHRQRTDRLHANASQQRSQWLGELLKGTSKLKVAYV